MTRFQVDPAKALWVAELPSGSYVQDDLASLIEIDHDEAETMYYEAEADPTNLQNERARHRYRGMYRRHVRHLEARARTQGPREAPGQP